MKILNIYTVISLNKKYFQYPRYKTVLPIKLNENQLDENWFWNGIIYRFARVHLSADIDEMELREGRLIRASSQEEQSLPSVTFSAFDRSTLSLSAYARSLIFASRKRARGLRVLDSGVHEPIEGSLSDFHFDIFFTLVIQEIRE